MSYFIAYPFNPFLLISYSALSMASQFTSKKSISVNNSLNKSSLNSQFPQPTSITLNRFIDVSLSICSFIYLVASTCTLYISNKSYLVPHLYIYYSIEIDQYSSYFFSTFQSFGSTQEASVKAKSSFYYDLISNLLPLFTYIKLIIFG